MQEAIQHKSAPSTPSPAILDAARLHREGRTAEAEEVCSKLLEAPATKFDALHLLGILKVQQGRHAEAVECLQAALTSAAGNSAVLSNLGGALAALGRTEEALAHYETALAGRPDLAHAWNNRGNALLKLGRPTEALESFDRAIALQPGFAQAHNNRGNALQALKRPLDALASYERSIAIQPDHVAAIQNRGAILLELERPQEALSSFDRVLEFAPGHIEALAQRGNALIKIGREDEALDCFDSALGDRGDYAVALASRGNALAELGRFEEALASYDRALQVPGDYPELLNNRGSALRALGRPAQAIVSFDRALALKPNQARAHNNRGNAMRDLGRLDEAIAAYRTAAALDPLLSEAHTNLGATHLELKQVEDAIASFDRVIALKPDHAEARLNRALARLFDGDFVAAREDYEYRWRVKAAPPQHGLSLIPEWNGENLRGKRIAIYEEQGLGDIIQFFRYVPLLLERGVDVSLLVRPTLHSLFRPYATNVRLIETPPPGATYDYQCALMSLPSVTGTTAETTPGDAPYLFAEPALAAKWRAKIGEYGLRIGVCWQGSPRKPIDVGRSLPLALFAPIAAIPGVRLISLQRGHGLDQLASLPGGMAVETLGRDFETCPGFEETAAAMAALDLVISCDTSVAHLAGALGRPVWVALKYASEWRWGHDTPACRWYPTARLYRQTVRNDWRSVLECMAADAGELISRLGLP